MFKSIPPIVDNLKFTDIGKSKIHGYGLFASIDIPKGAILGYLDGQVVPFINEYSEPFEWNCLSENTLLIRPVKTKYGFINHSRTPNLKILRYPLHIITISNIAQGEELTLDYRKEPLPISYLEGHGSTYL